MTRFHQWRFGGATAVTLLALSGTAAAASEVVVYCSSPEQECRAQVERFQRDTGIDVLMTRRSTGEVFALLKAEESRPRADIWLGGTDVVHLQAAEDGLLAPYESPMHEHLHDWSRNLLEISGNRTVGLFMNVLGFGYRSDIIDPESEEAPKCWADLLDERFRDDVQVANPHSSGTAYSFLTLAVHLFGEDEGMQFLKDLDANISQYTSSGAAPIRAVATGETAVGIIFQHDATPQIEGGAQLHLVTPCEGSAFNANNVALVEGGPNPGNARKFYDWSLTPEALAPVTVPFAWPAHVDAPLAEGTPALADLPLVEDFDITYFGSPETRQRLLARWDAEVASQ